MSNRHMHLKGIHVLAGYMAGLVAALIPVASVMMTILFVIYEFWEDRIVNDRDYVSIAEYASGYYLGVYSYMTMAALSGL